MPCSMTGRSKLPLTAALIPRLSYDTLDGKPVTAIGERAFYYSLSLTSVTIHDSVTCISKRAFSCCYNLMSIALPSGLTAIEPGTFELCNSLTSIAIPDSITTIAEDAFVSCKALQSFTLSPNHPYFFLADGALCRTAGNTLLFYPNARENRTYRIPDGIAAISAYAFYDCDLLESVVIPDSITQIPERAFYGCSALASVSLPDSLTEIGIAAFSFCAALTDIRLPASITEISAGLPFSRVLPRRAEIPDGVIIIGGDAFVGCTSLTQVIIRFRHRAGRESLPRSGLQSSPVLDK